MKAIKRVFVILVISHVSSSIVAMERANNYVIERWEKKSFEVSDSTKVQELDKRAIIIDSDIVPIDTNKQKARYFFSLLCNDGLEIKYIPLDAAKEAEKLTPLLFLAEYGPIALSKADSKYLVDIVDLLKKASDARKCHFQFEQIVTMLALELKNRNYDQVFRSVMLDYAQGLGFWSLYRALIMLNEESPTGHIYWRW